MKVAAVQIAVKESLEDNLSRAGALIDSAVQQGAGVYFPLSMSASLLFFKKGDTQTQTHARTDGSRQEHTPHTRTLTHTLSHFHAQT